MFDDLLKRRKEERIKSIDKQVRAAVSRALKIFYDWNDVTGFVPESSSYMGEIEAIVEDSVHCGIQQALGVYVKLEGEE